MPLAVVTRRVVLLLQRSHDCDEDRFAGFAAVKYLHYLFHGYARVEHHAFLPVLSHEYAPLRVFWRIARVYAHTIETWHAEQQRQPLLELRRLGHH